MIWDLEEAQAQHSTSEKLAKVLPLFLPVGVPVVDYGCGRGFYVEQLREAGFPAFGIEGTHGINDIGLVKDIIEKDLSKPLGFELPESTTLCLEVAEHIDPKYESVFLENITKNCNGRMILSWAIPHQGGHGHVNERDNLSVIEKIEALGFSLDFKASNQLRSMMKGDRCWWFENTLFVFNKI